MLLRQPLALLLLLGVLALPALGQFSSSQPKFHPRREDIKYIRCQACELLAKHAYKQIREMKKQATPSKPVTEERVIERIEIFADPLKDEGEWVAKVDLVEEGSKLVAKEMAELGECGVECKTLQRAVQDILDEHDTDIAEALFVGKKSRAKFSNWLCYELTNSCKSKPPPLPKDRQPGPAFKPADVEKLKMDRMLAGMQSQGMRGNLYSRDEAIAKYMQEQGGGDGDDEDAPFAAPIEDPEDTGSSDAEHPVNKLANTALEKGSEILGKAKEAAGPLLEGAAAGIEKAKEEARKLWDKFQAEPEPATKEGKAGVQVDSGEL